MRIPIPISRGVVQPAQNSIKPRATRLTGADHLEVINKYWNLSKNWTILRTGSRIFVSRSPGTVNSQRLNTERSRYRTAKTTRARTCCSCRRLGIRSRRCASAPRIKLEFIILAAINLIIRKLRSRWVPTIRIWLFRRRIGHRERPPLLGPRKCHLVQSSNNKKLKNSRIR